jgi:hypothetical protein
MALAQSSEMKVTLALLRERHEIIYCELTDIKKYEPVTLLLDAE